MLSVIDEDINDSDYDPQHYLESPPTSVPASSKRQNSSHPWSDLSPAELLKEVKKLEKGAGFCPLSVPTLSRSSSASSAVSNTPNFSFETTVSLEMQNRAANDKLIQDFGNDSVVTAVARGQEESRRLKWATEMIMMYPEECGHAYATLLG